MANRPGLLSRSAGTALLLFANVAWFDMESPQTLRETLVVPPPTLELLRSYLMSADAAERAKALDALRQVRDPSMAQAVKGLLNDPDSEVRSQTLRTLEALLAPAEVAPLLESKCADGSPTVVRQALAILGVVSGPEAFAALNRVGMTLHPDFLENWALAMARRDEPIESAVIERLLDSKDRAVRVAAMKIVLRNPAIIEPSRRVALLSDPNPWIRAQAIESLADNKDDPQVRRAVIDRLADASSIVRRSSLVWITGTEVELSTVQSYFDDEDATVRAAAVRVAGRIATPAAVTKLIQKFADREVLVARQAAEQLAAISSDGINSLLIDALADERDQVASQAARCLGMRQCHGALHTLQSLAGHASITVRVAAYEAIGAIGDPTVIPWLIETVKQETGYPRAAINQALGKLNAKQAIAHLIADCQYPDEKSKGLNPANFTPRGGPGPYPVADTAVATEAIRSLGELGDVAAVPVLILVSRDVLRNEPFWTAVVVSLGQLGEKQARGALVELGVVGTISQGMMGVSLPTTTRVAALRSIAKLELSDTVDVILTMDPQSADLSVRQAATEVLTQLTGTKYTYRVPVRLGSFFIEDRAEAVDPSPFKLPVAYPVETQ